MRDTRKKNVNWTIAEPDGIVPTWERVGIAVLMDIRDELQALLGILRCSEFQAIPRRLKRISANTAKPRRKAKR